MKKNLHKKASGAKVGRRGNGSCGKGADEFVSGCHGDGAVKVLPGGAQLQGNPLG